MFGARRDGRSRRGRRASNTSSRLLISRDSRNVHKAQVSRPSKRGLEKWVRKVRERGREKEGKKEKKRKEKKRKRSKVRKKKKQGGRDREERRIARRKRKYNIIEGLTTAVICLDARDVEVGQPAATPC